MDVLTKAFQDSIEGVIVIGSFLGEVEVGRDGETKYKVVFELEATEETFGPSCPVDKKNKLLE